jgi:hypothetical protein
MTKPPKKTPSKQREKFSKQREKFIEAAREAGADKS